MRPLLALALAAQLSGCATSWFVIQGTGSQTALDEDNHEVRVPQPGFTEHLIVQMPIATEYETTPGVNGAPAVRGKPLPFAFKCSRTQTGQDVIVRHAYRYGGGWKKGVIVAVLLEGAVAALGLLSATQDKPAGYIYGGFFALDAVLALPLIFIPRKEISAEGRVTVNAQLDDSCPEGVAVELAGRSYPINAAGRITAAAERELEQWRSQPSGPLEVSFSGQRRELRIDGSGDPTVELAVAPGTLTR
jgi:hypothetical protein